MSITKEEELTGMQEISDVVAITLKKMREFARPGITTKELDDFGAEVLKSYGARSAPHLAYKFPGCTCISVNEQFCHGVPTSTRILQEGDLINIDVSAELNGYWSDNGGSFIIGQDIHGHGKLVNASRDILYRAISKIRGGVKISDVGLLIETEAKKRGFRVIKNLNGHGIGRSLHEEPSEIANFRQPDQRRFRKNSVIALETFISTTSTYAVETPDGWTTVGNRGGFMAQHEHTIMVTDGMPLILTKLNGI